MHVSVKELLYNFLGGGLVGIILVVFLNLFKDHNAPEATGFIYGAPFLLPYFALAVYRYTGAAEIKPFATHVFLGLSLTLPMLLLLMFFAKNNPKFVLWINLVYIILISIGYLFIMKKKFNYSLS